MQYTIIHGDPDFLNGKMKELGDAWKPVLMSASNNKVYLLMRVEMKDDSQR